MKANVAACHFYAWRAQRGFTLVELIVVMVVAGILGAIGMARFFDRAGFDADAFAAQSKAMLRYAQKVAVASSRPVFVRIGADSIALCFDAACTAAGQVPAPGGANSGSAATRAHCADPAWYCEGRPGALALAPAASFYFDALGKPFAGADPAGSAASQFSQLTLNIDGDGATRRVIVVPETGYVY